MLIIWSLPLIWIVSIVLLARKRIIEVEQIRKELRKGAYNQKLDSKWMLVIGLALGLLIFIFSTLIGFIVIAYKDTIPTQIVNWISLSLLAVPFLCGGATSLLSLFFMYKRHNSNKILK